MFVFFSLNALLLVHLTDYAPKALLYVEICLIETKIVLIFMVVCRRLQQQTIVKCVQSAVL